MLKKEYRYFLFDLDRTIWDFDTNARNNIFSLIDSFHLNSVKKSDFYKAYESVNHRLWAKYEAGEIPKEHLRWKRFQETLSLFGIHNLKLAEQMGEAYLSNMPEQTALMPHSLEVLEELYNRGVKMAIITNGFKEVQYKKISNCKLDKFFEAVLVSEEQGVHKPSPVIFKRALNSIGGEKNSAIMVGDDFTNDIEGAMIFGIDQFFYNYKSIPCDGGPTYESEDLRDLLTFPTQQ